MDLMSIISQVYSLDVRLQVHFNHILTLLYIGDLGLPLLQCMYHRNSARSVKLPLCSMLSRRGLFYGGGSRVMVPIIHFFPPTPNQTIHRLFVLCVSLFSLMPQVHHIPQFCPMLMTIKFLKGN